MYPLRRWPAALVLVTCFFAWALSRPARAQSVASNLTYTAPGARAERGDLVAPAGEGPFPVILYLHGGSWRSGGKGEFHKLATDLAAKGYASFAIDYDLRPHSFPGSWNEARAALAYLRAHAAEYHLDPQRMIAAGTSAGGELAALLALAPEGPATGSADKAALPVAAAIILNGVFDLHSGVHVITRYLGVDCESAAPVCTDASPADHIHSGAPPFFIGHGTADHVVGYGEAQSFIAALRRANVPVTPFVAENGPHMYWEKKSFYAANLAAVESFLAQTLPHK